MSENERQAEKTPSGRSRALAAAKFLVGADVMGRAASAAVEAPISAGRDSVALAKAVLGGAGGKSPIISNETTPQGRFEDGLVQYRVGEEELAWRLRHSAKMFNTYLIAIGIILCLTIVNFPQSGQSHLNVASFCLVLVSGLMYATFLMGRWGFYNCQIRNRAFYPFVWYVSHPSEWFPSRRFVANRPGIRGKAKAVKAGVVSAVMIGFLSMAAPAMAATESTSDDSCAAGSNVLTATITIPCKTDLFRNALEVVFPDVGPLTQPEISFGGSGYSANSNGQSAAADAFATFIAVMFFIASGSLCFHLGVLIVNASQEGESISSRWSGAWTTARVCFGGSIIAPVVKGYCLTNFLILYAALWSGSLGNQIYNSYLSGLTSPTPSPHATIPGVTGVASRMAVSAVCYNLMRIQDMRAAEAGTSPIKVAASQISKSDPVLSFAHGQAGSGYSARLNKLRDSYSSTDATTSSNGSNTYSGDYITTWSFGNSCPAVSIRTTNPSETGAFGTYSQAEITAYNKFVTSFNKAIAPILEKEIGADTAISASQTQDLTSIRKAMADSEGQLYADMGAAVKSLLAVSNYGSIDNLIKGAQQYGWMTAGSFYMNFSRMQGLFDEFLAESPEAVQEQTDAGSGDTITIEGIDSTLDTPLYRDIYSKTVDAITASAGATTSVAKAGAVLASGSSAGSFEGLSIGTNSTRISDPQSMIGRLFSVVANYLGRMLTSLISYLTGSGTVAGDSSTATAPGSELEKMVEFGYNILNLAWLIVGIIGVGSIVGLVTKKFTLGGLASMVGKKVEDWSGISDIIGRISGVLTWIIAGLLVIGATHAYILPMLPYIQGNMFGMMTIILVVEGMIAGPIWALMHFRLDGNELVGHHQRAGYMIIFNMFLRVPTGILGMLLSISVFNAMILVLGVTFYPAVQAAVEPAGGSGILGSLVMLGIMTYLHYQIAIRSFSLISTVPSQIGRWFGATDAPDPTSGLMQGLAGFMAGQATSGTSAALGSVMGPGNRNGGGGGGGNGNGNGNDNGGGGGGKIADDVETAAKIAEPEVSSIAEDAANGEGNSAASAGAGSNSGQGLSGQELSAEGWNKNWEMAGNKAMNTPNAQALDGIGGFSQEENVNAVMQAARSAAGGQNAQAALADNAHVKAADSFFQSRGHQPTASERGAAEQTAKAGIEEASSLAGDAVILL